MVGHVNDYDVIVVGAGPAGTSAATVLGQLGRKALIVEKEVFPRYKVGESLIPYCYFPLERLGMIEKLNQSHFTEKYSVQFVSTEGKVSQPFYFFQHYDHPSSKTWQVVRSEFDRIMLDNALEQGADVMMETTVRHFLQDGEQVVGVEAQNKEGQRYELRAPVTIDASGRDMLSIKQHQWRVPDKSLNKMAVWTYYKGALRDEGMDAGATTVAYLPEKGWFWYIPLPDDVVSVGIVAEPSYLYKDGRDFATMFQREIENNPWIKEHLAPGKQCGQYYATSDYSYRSKYCAKDGLVLTGDAFSFLDPVFSSGVFLALRGGELAGEAIHEALDKGDVSAEHFEDYSNTLCYGIESMRRLVYAFYDKGFSFGELIKKYPHLRGDLTDCLIGHLFKDFEPLFSAVGEFANIPEPLTHGRPLEKVA